MLELLHGLLDLLVSLPPLIHMIVQIDVGLAPPANHNIPKDHLANERMVEEFASRTGKIYGITPYIDHSLDAKRRLLPSPAIKTVF